jgi:hypothetical protein
MTATTELATARARTILCTCGGFLDEWLGWYLALGIGKRTMLLESSGVICRRGSCATSLGLSDRRAAGSFLVLMRRLLA